MSLTELEREEELLAGEEDDRGDPLISPEDGNQRRDVLDLRVSEMTRDE